jgi:Zn-dependent protease
MQFPGIQQIILLAPPILFALTIHEFSHGYVAYYLGDSTAKAAGRLTLNPLKHLDPIGTIAVFIINFGWAKPVPVNPYFFKNPRKGMLWVGLAGPASNLIVAVISALLVKVFVALGSVLPLALTEPLQIMLTYSVLINVILCIFNLLPIPPLDGSRVLAGLLPEDKARSYESLEKRIGSMGLLIILILLMYTGILGRLINPIINFTLIAFNLPLRLS